MKNKIILLSIIIISALFFVVSCSKSKLDNSKVLSRNNDVKLITLSNENRTSITMLEFSSKHVYDSILTDLKQQMESYDDSFLAQYGYLNDSLLNEKEEEINYNDQQPLIDFENSLNFSNSMRQIYVIKEEDWLNNDSLDISEDPSKIYVFENEEMAMLNENGEVKIGVSLLKLTKDGFVEFTDGDINKLIRFDNGDMTVLNEPNVITNLNDNSRSSDCKWWASEDNEDNYASKKKVIMHEHFHAYPWKSTSSARITSYKKRGNRWKKYRISLGVANMSYFFDNNDCDDPAAQGWTDWKRKKKKSIRQHFTIWRAFPNYKAKNSASVTGYYEYSGNDNDDTLSW